MKKEVLLLVVGLVVILVVAILVTSPRQSPTPSVLEDQSQAVSPEERVIKQEASQVMSAFPAGFPFEEEMTSSDSYKYIPANSKEQQSTINYVSQKTLAENAKIFKAYLEEAGFKITNKVEEKSQYFYYAAKDNSDLSILVQQKNDQVTVSLSYLKR